MLFLQSNRSILRMSMLRLYNTSVAIHSSGSLVHLMPSTQPYIFYHVVCSQLDTNLLDCHIVSVYWLLLA
uniref:Uncharacterized protein n=1 Tax=Arundo donax TaxID=35708 RepID=A0A0A9G6J7_ARUDO